MTRNRLAAGATVAVLTAGTAGAILATAGPAAATSNRTVCADSLWVRQISNNQPIGILYRGDTFTLDHYSPSGDFAVGVGHRGSLAISGMVVTGYFTDAAGHCPS